MPERVAVIQVLNPTIQHPVPADPSHWLYKVRPGTVIQGHGNNFDIWVTNFTDLTEMDVVSVNLPPHTKISKVGAGAHTRTRIDIPAGAAAGAYEYRVELYNPGGPRFEASGESAPHVIIDP